MRKLLLVFLVFLLVAVWAAPAMGGKPLTTLVFDELPLQSVDGLSFEGVEFAYSVGGVPSTDAYYNHIGPGTGYTYVDCPCLLGYGGGTLTITFEKPTQVVEFGAGLGADSDLSPGFTVEVIDPNGKPRGVFDVDTVLLWDVSEGQFRYTKNAVKQVAITFHRDAFVLDNLSFHQAPRG